MKYNRFIIFVLLSLVCTVAEAVTAYPYPITKTLSDGRTVSIQKHGDEFFHYTSDANGYIVAQKENGDYYYARYDATDGKLRLSGDLIGTTSLERTREIPEICRRRASERRAAWQASLPKPNVSQGLTRSSGSPEILVLLVAYTDCGFTLPNPNQRFDKLFNEYGYSENQASGSVADYFRDNSNLLFEPQFVVKGPYTLPSVRSYYGQNDADGDDMRPKQMVIDALLEASRDGVDLFRFDTDKDGVLDNVLLIYAGQNEAAGGPEESIWPHRWVVGQSAGGIQVEDYCCSSELDFNGEQAAIGTFCHEFAHTLGLWDMYDADGSESGGDCAGLGVLSLMANGNYLNNSRTPPNLNVYERYMLGWGNLMEIKSEGTYRLACLSPTYSMGYTCRTDNENEFFVFENRQLRGWDTYIPGHGLLIYHVDRSQNMVYESRTAEEAWSRNLINAAPSHLCMYVVEADVAPNFREAFFPGKNAAHQEFASWTQPMAKSWSGTPLSVALTQITEQNAEIRFEAVPEKITYVNGTVRDINNDPIAGVTIVLQQKNTAQNAKGLRSMVLRSAANYSTTSDALGNYIIQNVAPGSYLLVAKKSGYIESVQEIEMPSGLIKDILLLKEQEQFYDKSLSWYTGGNYSYIGLGGSPFRMSVYWSPEDLAGCEHSQIGAVRLYIGEGRPSLIVKLLINDQEKASRTVSGDELTDYAYHRIDFMEDSVFLAPDDDLRIAVNVSGYPSDAYPMGVAKGPAVLEKSALIWNQNNWVSLVDLNPDLDVHWMLKADLYRQADFVPLNAFALTEHQMDMKVGDNHILMTEYDPLNATNRSIEWTSSDPKILEVSRVGKVKALREGKAFVKASVKNESFTDSCEIRVFPTMESGMFTQASQHAMYLSWRLLNDETRVRIESATGKGEDVRLYTTKDSWICIDSLTENTQYVVSLEAYKEDSLWDSHTLRLFTKARRTAKYMALGTAVFDHLDGKAMLLDVWNPVESIQAIEWYVDEQPVQPPLLPLSPGEHRLKAVVRMAKDGSEIIQRKMVIE